MHPNAALIDRFYRSFAARDHVGMIACYGPAIVFADPVFALGGRRVGAMWHMLCAAGEDLAITAAEIQADDARGTARWEAVYRFGPAGRRVHNRVAAEFSFAGGTIVRHRDRFSLWRWAGMALGPAGWALGWSPPLRARIRATAARRLARFVAERPEYQEGGPR